MKRVAAAGAVVAGVIVALLALRAGGARVVREAASTPPPASSAAGSTAVSASTPHAGATTTTTTVKPTTGNASGTVVIHGGYGSEPGQFGRRRDPESNPEAPMAVAAGPNGQLAVVDQVNRRILRYKDGKLVGTISMGGDTVQDIAFGRDGKLLVLDRLVDGNVQVYGADGKLANEVAIAGKGVTENGSITGLFSDDDGIYVENDHDSVVRIADAAGQSDQNRPVLAGRPSRDGRTLLAAEISDAGAGIVSVSAVDRSTGQPAWKQSLELGSSILHIITLDSDANGLVYLAVDVGREVPGAGVSDEKILLLRLGSGGAPRGVLAIPPLPTADEQFRPITVSDDGSVYVMAAGDGGLGVTRYVFP